VAGSPSRSRSCSARSSSAAARPRLARVEHALEASAKLVAELARGVPFDRAHAPS
jgi:hypothetical protein